MSIYSTILTQVKDRIEGLSLDGSPSVYRRKRFIVLEDEGDIIVVSPGQENVIGDSDGEDFEGGCIIRYPVFIGIALPYDGALLNGASEDRMLDMREDIRQSVYSITAVAPSQPVVGVSIDLQPAFDRTGLDRDNMNVSAIMVYYDIHEQREG